MAGFRQLIALMPAALQCRWLRRTEDDLVCSVTCDSRKAGPSTIFVALKGCRADGHEFVEQAIARGCVHVVLEQNLSLPPRVAVVQVNNSHLALGHLCAALYDYPARSMNMVAITGTNGKTTVSWLIEQMLLQGQYRVGVIGTVNYRYRDHTGKMVVVPAPLTTPDPVYLQKLLRAMADEGVSHVVMETSSHALQQHRLAGVAFDVCVFTNLSRDHLDFHGNMDAYFQAKQLLFSEHMADQGCAVIVQDQRQPTMQWAKGLAESLGREIGKERVVTCTIKGEGTVVADAVQMGVDGFSCTVRLREKKYPFASPLIGRFNVCNMLAAAGVGMALAMDETVMLQGLGRVRRVPGRLERVGLPGNYAGGPAVFVDYAHTPDALANVLETVRSLTQGRVICVFGCGGDRDSGKRVLMGEVVAKSADIAIITSDNPRSEDPVAIIKQIEGAFTDVMKPLSSQALLYASEVRQGYLSIEDRAVAITVACGAAHDGDVVLIAGKGHEEYQILGKKRIYFNDRVEAMTALLQWKCSHLLQATGGRVVSGKQSGQLRNVVTDSRRVDRGDIFLALAGETFDGHDFVEQAVKQGAGAVIVHQPVEPQPAHVLLIQVKDTLVALGDLAACRRRLLGQHLSVTAITGSSGKTTVKEMTAAIYTRHEQETTHAPVLKTRGNYNNLIGLPLSLLPVTARHRMAVLEMGMNSPGEIKRLAAIASPDIGCITNVQSAHLAGLGTIQGVARAKGELFAQMQPDTVAVVNYDDPLVRKLPVQSEKVIGFAVTAAGRRHKPSVRATRINNLGAAGMRFTLHIGDWKKCLTIPVPGEHNVSNSVAAAAIAHAAGIGGDTICAALVGFANIDKRMQFMTLPGGVEVLNDCYNANPDSMAAALTTVSTFGSHCRRVALLGDMLELGSNSGAAHFAIGQLVARLGYDQLAVLGDFAGDVESGARQHGMAERAVNRFSDTREVAAWLYDEMIMGRITSGDWLLVKGSRGMRMEQTLDELQRRFATGIEDGQ